MPDCWNVLECPLGYRVKCPAYPFAGHKCWTLEGQACDRAHVDADAASGCFDCSFFQLMMARKHLGEKQGAH